MTVPAAGLIAGTGAETTAALITGGAGLLGGLLGGGGPKRNYNYGFTQSESSGLSGSQQAGSSLSVQNPDQVWSEQAPYLRNLYDQSAATLAQQGPAQAQATQQINQGYGALSRLMNPEVNPMMQVYQEQLQQGLEDYILPAIRREATGVGMAGGTRQGVAEGLALQEAQRQQSNFAATLYGQDMDRMLAAAQSVPAMAQAGLGVPWYGLNQYAGILGSPTVLGQGGFSRSQQTGSSFGMESSSSRGEQAGGSRSYIEETFPDRFGGDNQPSSGFRPNTGGRINQR